MEVTHGRCRKDPSATHRRIACLRFVRINEQLAAINGQPVSRHLGTHLRDIIPEIAADVESVYHRVIASGEAALNLEVHGITPAEPTVEQDWMVSHYPVKSADGTMLGVSTVVQNITERKHAEEARRESEEQFRHLVEGSIQGILIHRGHKPLFVNQTWAALHGYTLEEILSMESNLSLIAPHDRERLMGYTGARLRGEDTPTHYAYQGIRKDGSMIWLDNMVRVITWQGDDSPSNPVPPRHRFR